MPLNVNTVNIPDGGNIFVNGIKPAIINVNSTQVWVASGVGNVIMDRTTISGANPETVTKIADGSFTFTAPIGITTIYISAMGGGGGGGGGRSGRNGDVLQDGNPGQGGFGGNPAIETAAVPIVIDLVGNPTATYDITIASGGAFGERGTAPSDGNCSGTNDNAIPGGDGGDTAIASLGTPHVTGIGGVGGAKGSTEADSSGKPGIGSSLGSGGTAGAAGTFGGGNGGDASNGTGYGAGAGGGGGGGTGSLGCNQGGDGGRGGTGSAGRMLISWG